MRYNPSPLVEEFPPEPASWLLRLLARSLRKRKVLNLDKTSWISCWIIRVTWQVLFPILNSYVWERLDKGKIRDKGKKIYLIYTSSGKIPKTVIWSSGGWIEMVNLREAFPEKEKKHCQRLPFDCEHLNASENIIKQMWLPESILRKLKTSWEKLKTLENPS